MAVVYRAVQEPLGRTVAVKALRSEVAAQDGSDGDGQFSARFAREARALAALQHENVIQIYDFVRVGGTAYIVMEFVDGIDLFDLLERVTVLSADVAAIVALSLARGLDHAHFHGFLHRDIKPANVMVGRSGAVKLMDFGIAREEAGGDLTRDGVGLGTPSYMSPEQAVGDRLDARSDLFGVGIVLYQMLVGKKPFVEDEGRSVLQKIRLDRPIPPRRLVPTVPRELDRIVMRCLEKRPDDRFASMQDLVFALERFLAPRCAMNHRARMVRFLQESGVVEGAEAERFLHPAIAGGYGTRGRRGFRAWIESHGELSRLIAANLGTVAAMGLLVGGLHVATGGAAARPEERAGGHVRVIPDGPGEILVDGKVVDRSVVAKGVVVAEGRHRIELRHGAAAETRTVQVQRGATQTVRIAARR